MRVEVDPHAIVRAASLNELRELKAACEVRIEAITRIEFTNEEKTLLLGDGVSNLVMAISMVKSRTGFGLIDCKFACEAFRNGSSRK